MLLSLSLCMERGKTGLLGEGREEEMPVTGATYAGICHESGVTHAAAGVQ